MKKRNIKNAKWLVCLIILLALILSYLLYQDQIKDLIFYGTFPEDNSDRKTFEYEFWLEYDKATWDNTYLIARVGDTQIGGRTPWKELPNLSLSETMMESGSSKCFDVVSGWFDVPTEIVLELYQYRSDTDESELIERRNLLVSPTWLGFRLEIVDSYVNPDVDWSVFE